MATFTPEQVLALVGARLDGDALVRAARRDDDGGSDGGNGGPGPDEDPTPTRSDIPEPILAAAKALSEESGCTVTCTQVADGPIMCKIYDCPQPPDLADPDRSELEEVLLRRLVEEAGKASRAIRIQRDRDPRKPNDPVERIDRKLALQEAAAAAFGDLLAEASSSDLAEVSRDACLSIAQRLLNVPGKDKLESAFRTFSGAGPNDRWTPEQAARELLTLSKYLKSWIAGVADGVLKGAGLPEVDREFWTGIRDAARAGG